MPKYSVCRLMVNMHLNGHAPQSCLLFKVCVTNMEKVTNVREKSLLFADEHSVAPAQVTSVPGSGQVGHELQIVSIRVHKARHRDDLITEDQSVIRAHGKTNINY